MNDTTTLAKQATIAWRVFYAASARNGVRVRGRRDSVDSCAYRKSLYALAAHCAQKKYDIDDYVETTVPMAVMSTQVLTPRALLYPEVNARYAEVLKHRRGLTRFEVEWNYERVRLLEALRSAEVDIDMLLADKSREMSPWFRVFGAMAPCQSVLDEHGPAALLALRNHAQLRQLISRERPVALRMLENAFGPVERASTGAEERIQLTVVSARPQVHG